MLIETFKAIPFWLPVEFRPNWLGLIKYKHRRGIGVERSASRSWQEGRMGTRPIARGRHY